jgi:hypothetical protein
MQAARAKDREVINARKLRAQRAEALNMLAASGSHGRRVGALAV